MKMSVDALVHYNYPVRANRSQGVERLVCLSVCLFVCLCACGHKNEQFAVERNRAVYELYLLCTSQKSKNISFYIPHERERTSGSREKQTFQVLWLS